MSRALLVTIVLTAVFAGFHYYFWRRLVHDTSPPPRWRRGATVVVVVLGTFLPLAMIGLRLGSHELKTWLAYPAYGWMGACFLLFLVLVVLELARLLVSLARRASGRGP